MSGPIYRGFVADPRANLALAKGDLDEARSQFRLVGDADPGQLPEYTYRACHVAIWAGDLDGARELFAIYEAQGGSGAIRSARMAALSAGIAALEGRNANALALYRVALDTWRTAGAVWDETLTGISMAQLLDHDEPEVAAAIKSTREILERLRAIPYLERLDSAAGSQGGNRKASKRAAIEAVPAA